MTHITDRTEIAKALNFHVRPTLTIDLDDTDWYGLKGSTFEIDNGHFKSGDPYYICATLRVYSDAKRLTFSQEPCMISASFNYSDVEEMMTHATSPIVHPDEDVNIVIHSTKRREVYDIMVVHFDKHHMFENVDFSRYFPQ